MSEPQSLNFWQKCIFIGFVCVAIGLVGGNAKHAEAVRSLYISEDSLNLGIACTSSGDNVASLDAIYLMSSTSDINTPTTGFDSPNPLVSPACPSTGIPIYGPDGVLDVRSGLVSNGYEDSALRLKVDPAGVSPTIYDYAYLNICEGENQWSFDNQCSGGTPTTTPTTTPAVASETCTYFYGGTSTPCTQIVDNPNLNMALGFILFLMTFAGIITLFKPKGA